MARVLQLQPAQGIQESHVALVSSALDPHTTRVREMGGADDTEGEAAHQAPAEGQTQDGDGPTPWYSRQRYSGTLLYNLLANLLPALYSTLVKLWVVKIDSRMVVTTDVYTYMVTIAEVFNEGLPRAAWTTIGDSSSRTWAQRLALAHTLMLAQAALGLVQSLSLLGAAKYSPGASSPPSFSAFSSAVETAVAASTRALDEPDVPLFLSCVKFVLNIVLDMLLISPFRVVALEPTVNVQAGIQQACNLTSAFCALAYFLLLRDGRRRGREASAGACTAPSLSALRVLLRPGFYTLIESAIRNALYLWLVSTIVSLGSTYATAWGIFNTMRWGLIMVLVLALETTTLTFVGHNWGCWRREMGAATLRPRASLASLKRIARPAFVSAGIALGFEVPTCVFMSLVGVRPVARYLSGSDSVTDVTERMWKTLDWCYIMYAVSTQLAALLLATQPKWYLWQSLASNLLYVLPWAIFCQVADLDVHNAWPYHAFVFGGSLVFSFVCGPFVLGLWAWRLWTGRAQPKTVK